MELIDNINYNKLNLIDMWLHKRVDAAGSIAQLESRIDDNHYYWRYGINKQQDEDDLAEKRAELLEIDKAIKMILEL